MKYIDMHCDTLTVCRDGGYGLAECSLQINLKSLARSGCKAQCFAVFTEGVGAKERFFDYLAFFKNQIEEHGDLLLPVKEYSDLSRAEKDGKVGAVLTVENLGFTGGDLSILSGLKSAGVKMASLVWNNENAFARPNLIFENGLPAFEKSESRGLTALGRQAVEMLDGLKIIVDISHLSDGGAEEILSGRKIPLVASHSNARGVCNVSRNLSDGLIKKIAACGGAVGVNFCADFLGGQAFESVARHLKRIINVGGEDVIAFGSDFDGIPENPDIPDCTRMPSLLEYLEGELSPRVVEKLACKNFERVFKSVCG
ncbi:MAG: dipeptidase [Clostridia bacterium]|nr:dipeptidase [Clostridia bacterium]